MIEKPDVKVRVFFVCIVCDTKGVHHWPPTDGRCRKCGRVGGLVKCDRPQLPELTPNLTRIKRRVLIQPLSKSSIPVQRERDERQKSEPQIESESQTMAKKTTKTEVKNVTKTATTGKVVKSTGTNPETGRLRFTKGRSLGLGITETWVKIFRDNEQAKKADKQTDAAIAKFMLKEFPEQATKPFVLMREGKLWAVQGQRARYNRGAMTVGVSPQTSHRYGDEGEYDDTPYSGKKGVTVDQLSELMGSKVRKDHLEKAAVKRPAREKEAEKEVAKAKVKAKVKVKRPAKKTEPVDSLEE